MWLDFALGVLQAIAWPLLIVGGLIVFRKQIRGLLENIESAKVAGVETTFYKQVLEDPTTSDEIKDAAARLWMSASMAKGQPTPQLASDRLDGTQRKRGRPASGRVVKAVADQSYAEQVGAALERISDGRIKVGPGHSLYVPEYGYQDSSFIVRPDHGYGALWVYARTDEAEIRSWTSAGVIGDMRPANPNLPDVLVVSPYEIEADNFRTVSWKDSGDDEKLANVLEEAGVFDFLEA